MLLIENKLGNMQGGGGGYTPSKVTGVRVVPFRVLNLWVGTV